MENCMQDCMESQMANCAAKYLFKPWLSSRPAVLAAKGPRIRKHGKRHLPGGDQRREFSWQVSQLADSDYRRSARASSAPVWHALKAHSKAEDIISFSFCPSQMLDSRPLLRVRPVFNLDNMPRLWIGVTFAGRHRCLNARRRCWSQTASCRITLPLPTKLVSTAMAAGAFDTSVTADVDAANSVVQNSCH